MKRLGTTLALLWATTLATAAVRPDTEWTRLEARDLPEGWRRIADQLHAVELVRAGFEEERHNRLRRRPTRFDGDLIYARDLGLSLRYDAALESTIIFDHAGIVRRAGGADRELPLPEDEVGLHGMILQLFAFDLVALEDSFVIEGAGPPDDWALRLVPRDDERRHALGVDEVIFEGSAGVVQEIYFDRPGSLELRLQIEDPTFGGQLSEAERAARFR